MRIRNLSGYFTALFLLAANTLADQSPPQHTPVQHAALTLQMETGLPDFARPGDSALAAAIRQAVTQQRDCDCTASVLMTQTSKPPQPSAISLSWLYLLASMLVLSALAWRYKYNLKNRIGNLVHTAFKFSGKTASRPQDDITRWAADLRLFEPASAPATDLIDYSSDHGEAAIELLQAETAKNPDASPIPWLLLLDALHRAGDKTRYEQTRAHCQQHFNLDMPHFEHSAERPATKGLEGYPHVLDKLIRLWPASAQADAYLDALIRDCRGGNRVGFDLDTYREIALLRAILQYETESIARLDR